jgi:hypothetical protein
LCENVEAQMDEFHDLEVVCVGGQLRLRRSLLQSGALRGGNLGRLVGDAGGIRPDGVVWQLRYAAPAELGEQSRHVHVRNVVDVAMMAHDTNALQFISELGYDPEFAFALKGKYNVNGPHLTASTSGTSVL